MAERRKEDIGDGRGPGSSEKLLTAATANASFEEQMVADLEGWWSSPMDPSSH
jgi:hypothetical protein